MSPEPTVNELFDISGRSALITGASGWLGRSMANALAEAGADVVVASRDRSRAETVRSNLPGGSHYSVVIDQLDPDSIKSGFEEALDSAGKLDILVACGHQSNAGDWRSVDAEAMNRDLQNCSGTFELARLLHDHVVERAASGSVVFIGSMYGEVASYPDAYAGICPANPVSYQALKAAIIQMARHLSVYWAADRVRVNCLSPGPFPGPAAPDELVERLKTRLPLQRTGKPWELKGACVFLASDASSFVTGHNLVVDGGWTAW